VTLTHPLSFAVIFSLYLFKYVIIVYCCHNYCVLLVFSLPLKAWCDFCTCRKTQICKWKNVLMMLFDNPATGYIKCIPSQNLFLFRFSVVSVRWWALSFMFMGLFYNVRIFVVVHIAAPQRLLKTLCANFILFL